MNIPVEKRLLIVWLALSGVSVLQLWFSAPGTGQGLTPSYAITFGVIVLSLIKVRFIIREFMEVRHAPALLMQLTDLWLLINGLALLGTYSVGMALATN